LAFVPSLSWQVIVFHAMKTHKKRLRDLQLLCTPMCVTTVLEIFHCIGQCEHHGRRGATLGSAGRNRRGRPSQIDPTI
jgi:hypothetical protein